jgi:hypothetical protein
MGGHEQPTRSTVTPGIVDVAGRKRSPRLKPGQRAAIAQLFVGFSDHRGIGLIVGFSVAVFLFILVVIIVWVSRRRRVAFNGELDQ